ncbi:MAG: hypothetical protein DWQ02_20805 [Bacteroidetes bacterium]|nr:MAG: hypothetical protein DWQ02_20805 [Bacteroidota bacterium]
MRPLKHISHLFAALILSFLVMAPFQSLAQVNKAQAMATAKKKGFSSNDKTYPFRFSPAGDQKMEFQVYPTTDLLHLKLKWEGSAGEIKVSIIARSIYDKKYLAIEGRSPLYVTHSFESSSTRQKLKWIVVVENLHPALTARGVVAILPSKNLAQGTKAQRRPSGSPQSGEMLRSEFNQLDRSDWGRSVKNYKSNGAVQIEYENGNYVLSESGTTLFYDAGKHIRYKIVTKRKTGPQVIVAVQLPDEPPAPDLFTDEARTWRRLVEGWVYAYNEELLDEIKVLMDQDEDLIEKYIAVERKQDKKFFELLQFRSAVIKNLREIYGE